MEIKKISFAVENVEIIEPKKESQFATLKIDAFASGQNRHELYVSDATLKKTAETIREKPLVWILDKRFLDAGTHDELETPCGFIPKDSPIEFRQLPDGRTMMTVMAKLWTRYSGKLLDFFKRDNFEKPVSVEMSVYKQEDTENGREITDYIYECITILGSLVTPAIKNARAELVEFAIKEKQEYEKVYKETFSTRYDSLLMDVPSAVKDNAQMGLDLYKQYGMGGNSVNLAAARALVKNQKSSPEKIRHIAKSFRNKKYDNMVKDPPSAEYICFLLYGGGDGKEWSEKLSKELDDLDNKRISYFNFSEDESKEKEEKLVDEELEKKEDMAAETPEEEKKEDPKEEEKETPEEEKKEEMSLDANLDLAAVLAMLANETEDYKVLVQDFSDEGTKNYAKLAYALYSKVMAVQEMCNKFAAEKEEMCGKFAEADEKNKAYMAENEELKKFKADVEARQFMFEVDSTLKEIEMSVAIPKSEMEFLVEESKKFSLATVDAFKNLAKAKAFGFAVKGKKEDEPKRYALPFVLTDNSKKANSPW